MGNNDRIRDPYIGFGEIYEITHGDKNNDFPLYLEYASISGSPILDIGCGTGRVSFMLAQAGYDVTVIELCEDMLHIAKKKLQRNPDEVQKRLNLLQHDMCELNLPQRNFKLILMPYGEFAHVLTRERQQITLEKISQHLDVDGLLIISMSNWNPQCEPFIISFQEAININGESIESMPITYEGTFTHHVKQQRIIRYIARGYDPSVQIAIHTYIHEISEITGRVVARTVHVFPLRYIFRYEMELLLDKTGFTVEAIYGYYDKSPFTYNSQRMIFIAKRS